MSLDKSPVRLVPPSTMLSDDTVQSQSPPFPFIFSLKIDNNETFDSELYLKSINYTAK